MNTEMELSLYIHWPFCLSKCPYCAFNSIAYPHNEEIFKKFENALLKELKNSLQKLSVTSINTIFFGGGTPSLMNPSAIYEILNFLHKNYPIRDDIEISLEANPGTFDKNKLQKFKEAGINRFSLGIQSFSDKNLRFLGRIYDENRARVSAEVVSLIFKNFSFDFMYGYTYQEEDSLINDLQLACELGCPHISCYQLTIEDETPFFNRHLKGEIGICEENTQADLYESINSFLSNKNLYRYEVSNYARPNFECKHNLCYWEYGNFLGIGPGAHSRLLLQNERCALENERNPFEWLQKIQNREDYIIHKQYLSKKEELEEIFIMGMRLSKGLNITALFENIPAEILGKVITHKKINFLVSKGLLIPEALNDNYLQLTSEGFLKLDSIIEFFLT